MERGLRWVVDVDISKYFDTIDHAKLRRFLDQRVTDGVVRKMIDKWLKAGALDKGVLTRTTRGTPQGGVDHSPNAKGNFCFDRVMPLDRSQVVLDLRLKR